MWFSSLRIFSVVLLFAICSTALPATDVRVANQLEKRTPRDDAANAFQFDQSVSPTDRLQIQVAIREMIDLATAAALMDYTGIRSGMYLRWMPAGREDQVKSLFKLIAGIPQFWGARQQGQYDFSRITIARAKTTNRPLTQAQLFRDGDRSTLVIYDFGMQTPMRHDITPARVGTRTSQKMEFLGAVLLHEVLHVYSVLTHTICAPSSATLDRRYVIVDDQEQTVVPGLKLRSYGPWMSKRLKDHNAGLAFLNNDNYMYLALEAYWSQVLGRTSWSSPQIDILPGCPDIGPFMNWCWHR